MTKKQLLQDLVNQIAALTNQATNKEDAISKGLDRYLFIDHASIYGGYRLVNVKVNGGGHSSSILGSDSCNRQTFKTFEQMLRTCINGLEFNK